MVFLKTIPQYFVWQCCMGSFSFSFFFCSFFFNGNISFFRAVVAKEVKNHVNLFGRCVLSTYPSIC